MAVQLDSEPTPARTGQGRPSPPRMPESSDHREGLLIVFVAATLVMVVVVALLGAAGHWWALLPAMLIDLVLTFVIIAGITRLLADDGEVHPPGRSAPARGGQRRRKTKS